MVVLRSPEALKRRFEKRFERMNRECIRAVQRRRQDIAAGVMLMHLGTPTGPGRRAALRAADYPFARRHGSPLWQTPPVGIISGALLASLRFTTNVRNSSTLSGGVYTVSAKSVGTGYAHFVYMPGGTSKIVDRHIKDAAYALNQMLSQRTVFELAMIQRRLL